MNLFFVLFNKVNTERFLINKFREEGACSVSLAKPLEDIGDINKSMFYKLIRKGVIERGERGKYFLNEYGLMKYRMDRAKWGMISLFILLGIIILFKGNY